jgi:hypothetical protein
MVVYRNAHSRNAPTVGFTLAIFAKSGSVSSQTLNLAVFQQSKITLLLLKSVNDST